jgi:NAD+ kinase
MTKPTVGVCLKPEDSAAAQALRELNKGLAERDIAVLLDPVAGRCLGREGVALPELARRVGLLVVLGGDGTLLGVAREIGESTVPILGVNLGTRGFLAEISPGEQFEAVERALRGDMPIEPRARLEVVVEREGRVAARHVALNEVVVGSTHSRLVDLETWADARPVATYRADGLIVSTPTGSTAYSLSAAGPILLPDVRALVLTPICPHTLSQRPLVLPDSMEVTVRAVSRHGVDVRVTVDGQDGMELAAGDHVRIRRSERPLLLVLSPHHDRFETLRRKLGWGAA